MERLLLAVLLLVGSVHAETGAEPATESGADAQAPEDGAAGTDAADAGADHDAADEGTTPGSDAEGQGSTHDPGADDLDATHESDADDKATTPESDADGADPAEADEPASNDTVADGTGAQTQASATAPATTASDGAQTHQSSTIVQVGGQGGSRCELVEWWGPARPTYLVVDPDECFISEDVRRLVPVII